MTTTENGSGAVAAANDQTNGGAIAFANRLADAAASIADALSVLEIANASALARARVDGASDLALRGARIVADTLAPVAAAAVDVQRIADEIRTRGDDALASLAAYVRENEARDVASRFGSIVVEIDTGAVVAEIRGALAVRASIVGELREIAGEFDESRVYAVTDADLIRLGERIAVIAVELDGFVDPHASVESCTLHGNRQPSDVPPVGVLAAELERATVIA